MRLERVCKGPCWAVLWAEGCVFGLVLVVVGVCVYYFVDRCLLFL